MSTAEESASVSRRAAALDSTELDSDLEDLAQGVADQVASFLIAVRELAHRGQSATAVPLLLLEVSQLLLAGARLGVMTDLVPAEEYEPEVGPDHDLDRIREELAGLLGPADEYVEVFDPYAHQAELVPGRISDDVAAIAERLAHGLAHHRAGRVSEALWWWQFSYVSSWGAEASAVLRALQAIVAHDRLDEEGTATIEMERIAAAEDLTDGATDAAADDETRTEAGGESDDETGTGAGARGPGPSP